MGNTLERPTAPDDEFPWLFQQLRLQNHETQTLANALREQNRQRRRPEHRGRLPCRFYTQGFCIHGANCRFAHDGPVTRTRRPDRRQREPCRYYAQGICTHGEACRFSHEGPGPVREPCRFFAKGFCKRGATCRYAHDQPNTEWMEEPKYAEQWTREIGGAWVEFGDGAAVTNVTLLSDFSAIQMRHLPPRSSARSVKELLADVGISVSISDINFIKLVKNRNGMAIVNVKDPDFAKSACWKLRTYIRAPDLEVTQIPVPLPDGSSFGLVDSRNVRCSWHRPTRNATLSFRNPTEAFESYHKLKKQQLKIAGLPVAAKMPAAADATEKDGPWQMELEALVVTILPEDIINIFPSSGTPYEVQMGDPSYETDSDIDSTIIKSLLYDVGALEQWEVFGSPTARRVKAQARFIEESEALDAVAQLNETWLSFNPSGKLYLQHVHLVKFRVSTRVYGVVEESIESLRKDWERQFINFSSIPETGYRVLKLESQDREPFTQAKEALEKIINGTTMTLNGKNLWSPDFKADRGAYRRLQEIEQGLGVVIIRDIKSSKFRVFGPEDKIVPACEALDQLLQELEPRSTGHNTEQSQAKKATEGDCAVCFCEADQALATSCGHVYCTICFVNMCQVEASTIGDFSIKCIGDQGRCKKAVPLHEIQNLLLSEIFESVLEASFASFMRRHQDQLRYCATPACTQVYRIAQPETSVPPIFTCAKCMTATCTSCHVSHPRKTCAEYKGNESGGMAELLKAKEELGFKDCPKCNTHIQKDEGCNHINCTACGTHICWLCLKTFTDGDDCYQHMGRVHGGIGNEGEHEDDDDDIDW
ncbi:hypothetical protein FNYG_04081 [Fusarium nygamai]|uniref:RING-type E3 ubiquitin transferase n=1 Tax=Gibberella nygamai TaxID=42673 RepID=A0A2K0WKP8_GIBNY|nr:hypothetical protein FNYG_04081 [Fusarium nygamai]